MGCWLWCFGGTCLCGVFKCVGDKKKSNKLRAAAVGGTFVALNDFETQSLGVPSQATATVYEGSCPELWLRGRVAEIVRANPWLSGRLKTNPDTGKIALWIPDNVNDTTYLEVIRVLNAAGVSGNSSPECFVKVGADLVDKHEPVCKIVALTEPSGKRWGLQVSMSHVLTDGHTFYTIYGMLDKDAEVWATQVERVKFNPMTCLQGVPRHGKWMFYIKKVIGRSMRKQKDHKLVYQMRYVREDWVEEQKRGYVAGPDAPFLSVNDILTWWFFQATQPAAGSMACNMRNRIAGLEAKHAGNYGSLLIYYPTEYNDPANIRRSVTRLSPACTPDGSQQKPGQGPYIGVGTSWHMFYRDVNFEGCKQLTHFPCHQCPIDPRIAHHPPMFALFRPAAGKLAMLTMTLKALPEGPLGDTVLGAEALLAQINASS